jgi:integrase
MPKSKRGAGEGTYYMDGDLFAWKIRAGGVPVVRKAATQKALKTKVRAVLAEMEERGGPQTRTERAATVGGYLTDWLETFVRPNRAAKTYRQYEQIVRNYIAPAIGRIRMADLRAGDVQRMINDLQSPSIGTGPDGTPVVIDALSPTTAGIARVVLRRAMNVAVKQRLILANPVDGTEPPRRGLKQLRAMTPEQSETFLRAAAASGSRYAPALILLASCGLRISECIGLMWTDVDGPQIHVRRTLEWQSGAWNLSPTKTKRGNRTVPLNAAAAAALRDQAAMAAADRERIGDEHLSHGLIFTTETGRPMIERNVQRAMDAVLKSAGLPHFGLHDLRRTFGTTLARRGVPVHVLQALMGHENPQTTMTHYLSAFDTDMAAAVALLDA